MQLHPFGPGDLLLHRAAPHGAGGLCSGGLSVERQRDAALGEDVVGCVNEVEGLSHADVGDGLVDDLLYLDRGDPAGEGGTEHDPVLTQRLAGDEGRELHHEPGPGVEAGVPERLVEGEVVEDLDQLGIGNLQGRDMAGE